MNDRLCDSPTVLTTSGSAALRTETEIAHRAAERALDLPDSIQSEADYLRWLGRFLGVYEPLEAELAGFEEWPDWGISLRQAGHMEALRRDLEVLEAPQERIPLASREQLPALRTFAEAFGALYVLEGSKLGGRFILKGITERLGAGIAGATAFFTGHGAQSGPRWNAFKESLDTFLASNPEEFPQVVAGAQATFASIQAWMSPLRQAAKP